MVLTKASIFILTFVIAAVLVIIIKKNRNMEQEVVVYFIGFKEFEEQGKDEEHEVSGQLHVTQVVKKLEDGVIPIKVPVEFPNNGQDYRIMLVKVLNYNSQVSTRQLIRQRKDDKDFWVLISEGAIGSNSVTVEINSNVDIDVDVEFYGYKIDGVNATVDLEHEEAL